MASRPVPLFVNEMMMPQFVGGGSFFVGQPLITFMPSEQMQQLVGTSRSESPQTMAPSNSTSLVPFPTGFSSSMSSNSIVGQQVDISRYQSMQSTIRHLQTMLGKEVRERKCHDEEMMALLEESRKANQSLREQLQQALDSKLKTEAKMQAGLEDTLAARAELFSSHKRLMDSEGELDEARKYIKELKEANACLEIKLGQSQNQLKVVQTELLELKDAKSIMENVLLELKVSLDNMKKDTEDLKAENASLKCAAEKMSFEKESQPALEQPQESEQHLALLRSSAKQLELQEKLEEAEKTNKSLEEKFIEVSLRLVLSVAYGGEQMYNRYVRKTQEFIKKLEMVRALSSKDPAMCANVQRTIEVLKEQLRSIEDCREDLKMTVEVLKQRLIKGIALVSDLTFRPRQPDFRIPPSCYDELLSKITGLRADVLAGKDEDDEELPTPGDPPAPVPSWLC